jgi:SAM-dependent methyltransferase
LRGRDAGASCRGGPRDRSSALAQNIYDRSDFFAGYSALDRSVRGLEGAPEWPALREMLPDLRGLHVADLGCGFGWFCRWAQEQGAATILGIDISERMLARARAAPGAGVAYERADLDQLALPEAAFDLVYSSLALHYVEDAGTLFATVQRALAPGGRLVFSTEHPIVMAPRRPGWHVDADGLKAWPVSRYFDEGARVTDWLASGVVKHHRTMGTTLNLLIRSGFTIDRVVEFCPTSEQIAAQPGLIEERERPMFLMVAANR